MKTVGIRLLDFDDKSGGRGLLGESCLLDEVDEKEGEWRRFWTRSEGPDGSR
jgi:IS4 transposase